MSKSSIIIPTIFSGNYNSYSGGSLNYNSIIYGNDYVPNNLELTGSSPFLTTKLFNEIQEGTGYIGATFASQSLMTNLDGVNWVKYAERFGSYFDVIEDSFENAAGVINKELKSGLTFKMMRQ